MITSIVWNNLMQAESETQLKDFSHLQLFESANYTFTQDVDLYQTTHLILWQTLCLLTFC